MFKGVSTDTMTRLWEVPQMWPLLWLPGVRGESFTSGWREGVIRVGSSPQGGADRRHSKPETFLDEEGHIVLAEVLVLVSASASTHKAPPWRRAALSLETASTFPADRETPRSCEIHRKPQRSGAHKPHLPFTVREEMWLVLFKMQTC